MICNVKFIHDIVPVEYEQNISLVAQLAILGISPCPVVWCC